MKTKMERLLEGETFLTKERGNSMLPLIRSGQGHILQPITWDKCVAGDIVYCKIKGKFYTHLVKKIDKIKGCLIVNTKGYQNGWTKNIYGRVVRII